jgi:hypothetical protein
MLHPVLSIKNDVTEECLVELAEALMKSQHKT